MTSNHDMSANEKAPESCANCRFFRAIVRPIYDTDFIGGHAFRKETGKTETVTQCRRRAPLFVVMRGDQNIEAQSGWPDVTGDEWCGEYAAKEAT